jgi:tetratricopeptide (TPR) repeat protein
MERPLVMQSLVRSFRAAAMQAQGRRREAVAVLGDAVRLARTCRDVDALGMALRTLAEGYECMAEPSQAKALLLEMLGVAREYEDVGYAAEMEWLLGRLALIEGDWVEARRRFEQAALSGRMEPVSQMEEGAPYAQSAAISLAWLDVLQGRDTRDEAAPLVVLSRALESSAARDLRLQAARALAERDLARGDTSNVKARLHMVLEGPLRHTQQAVGLLALQAWAELQDEAISRAEELLQEATERAATAQNGMVDLDILHVTSLRASHAGRWEDAESSLQELLTRCRQVPYPWMEVKALYVQGQLLRATTEPALARKAFEQALAICDRLGERLYAEQIERALAELLTST